MNTAADEERGAAAEASSSTAKPTRAATTYNVREYQNPDAGAADQPLTKAAKANTKGTAIPAPS